MMIFDSLRASLTLCVGTIRLRFWIPSSIFWSIFCCRPNEALKNKLLLYFREKVFIPWGTVEATDEFDMDYLFWKYVFLDIYVTSEPSATIQLRIERIFYFVMKNKCNIFHVCSSKQNYFWIKSEFWAKNQWSQVFVSERYIEVYVFSIDFINIWYACVNKCKM